MNSLLNKGQIGELLLDYLVRQAALVVVIVDHSGLILEANHYTARLAGCDVTGLWFADLLLDFHGRFDFAGVFAEQESPHLLHIRTATGLPLTCYFHFHRLDETILAIGQQSPEETEELRRAMLNMNSELTNLTRQLHKKTAVLEKLDAQKNQFFGMAAHDIRHPLGVIAMFSEFLEAETAAQSSEQHREFLGYIRSSAQLMEEILTDFLDFSVFESGRLSLAREPIDLGSWLTETVARTRLLASRRQVELVLHIPSEPVLLVIDLSKMAQVFYNLLSNALKFSPPGGRIEVRLVSFPTEAVLSVQDQGPGIALEYQPRLFNPYVRAAKAKLQQEKGSGLGLAIVKKIIDAHGGRLWLESVLGQGATFFCALPLTGTATEP